MGATSRENPLAAMSFFRTLAMYPFQTSWICLLGSVWHVWIGKRGRRDNSQMGESLVLRPGPVGRGRIDIIAIAWVVSR